MQEEILRPIIEKLKKLESERLAIVNMLKSAREKSFSIDGITLEKVVNKVKKVELNCRVGGVDGGLLIKSLHGIDLVLARAAGVIFHYFENKLIHSSSLVSPVRFRLLESEDDSELSRKASIFRAMLEINLALKIAKSVDFTFLDGTVYPHPSLKNEEGYEELKEAYEKLAERSKVIGIIKDSRSRFIAENMIGTRKFRDTVLLHDVLSTGERTFVFKIFKKESEKELSYANKVFGFYIKTVPRDRPVRVEFISEDPSQDADEIASLVYSLSVFRNYGIPSVLIEADARAKLPQNFIDYFVNGIRSKQASALVMELRRDNRPIW